MPEILPGRDINKREINYGRKGEGHVDIAAAAQKNMEALKKGSLPEKDQEKHYDLAGELKKEFSGEIKTSPVEINAITEKVRSLIGTINDKKGLYESKGISGEEVERLLDIAKQEALKEAGVSEDLYEIDDMDDLELKISKFDLKKTVDGLNAIGKMQL
ncbi:MAG: hypothetical protein PHW24_04915 [Candidatus Moranbacteria bacterium]|nr:hypothetical protein [Candidatus Moranbacteria bacterium]